MDNKYEIKKYEKDFPLSTHIEYLDYKAGEEVHLRDYLNVVLKRKWIVLTFLVSVLITTTILTFMMTPLYKSTTVVKIDKDNPNVLSFRDVISTPGADYYQTQYEIFKSRNLAERVIKNLGLDKNDDFMPIENRLSVIKRKVFNNTIGLFIRFFSSVIPKNTPKKVHVSSNPTTKSEVPDYLISSLIGRLEVNPVKNSQLVKVSFISHNPELSMNIANAVAETYISFDLESRIEATKDAKIFLEQQIEVVKKKMEDSEQKLNEYASHKEIIIDQGKESILTQKLADISSALNNITNERMQKEALYREVKESGGNNPVILNNSLIMGLKKEFASLEAEYSNLSKIYTPDYPKMKSLKSEMDAIQSRIDQEMSRIVNSLESDYNAALKKEENLTKAFNSQKRKVLSFQDTVAQYEVLRREVEVNKGLYNNLLQRHNELGVSASSSATNIQILDKATYPKSPFKPNVSFNILLSIIFGLMGGIGLAFLAEYFDNSIKDTDYIEKKINLPTLGMIPKYEDAGNSKNFSVSRPRIISPQKEADSSKMPMVIGHDKISPIAETFRSIGAFILLSSSSKPPKTILVTGPGEKVGKTTICVNIAKTFLESSGNVLIIDADLRRPKLHNAFQLDNSIGLSSFLSGNVDFDDANGRLIKPTSVKGLSVITSGPVPPNPSELIGSLRMQDFINILQESFQFIIVDSPPVMGLPDALYLSKIVDGTIIVVQAGVTPRKALTEVKNVFGAINSKILGVILNGVKKSDFKYGSYNYYYSSYYSSYFKEEK
ncbi:MAG: polysaccharide biosynthesis tyrosine autokinase [Nitrospirota bacterium]